MIARIRKSKIKVVGMSYFDVTYDDATHFRLGVSGAVVFAAVVFAAVALGVRFS
ncbi:MAG: hypothetical protein ACI9HK_004985 [Pirellulaceae bacterium]